MDRKTENKFYDLFGLQLSGEISTTQIEELQQLIREHPALHNLYTELLNTPTPAPYNSETLEQAYAGHYINKKFLPELQQPAVKTLSVAHKKTKTWLGYISFAAASVIAIVLGFYFLNKSTVTEAVKTSKNEMTTPKGSKSKVVLPDGTKVFLNADSRIVYEEDFNKKTREVALTGEAYFDVMHDAARPFIIHTGKADIKVLGTTFNVRNYPGEEFIETALIRGRIEVSLENDQSKKIILKPSEKLVLSRKTIADKESKSGNVLILSHITLKDSVVAETSWMNNRIILIDKPLYEIATELERQFNMKVIFKSPATKNYHYTINVENSSPQEIMEILELSRKINYTLTKNNELIIE